MIFEKLNINLRHTNSNFWNLNLEPIERIVRGRKYRIRRKNIGVTIERKVSDISDTMGFVPLKVLGNADGKIERNGNEIAINFNIRLKPIYEYLFIASGIISLLSIMFLCFEDLKTGLLLGLFLVVILSIIFLFIKFGLNGFKTDLENDIDYFEN